MRISKVDIFTNAIIFHSVSLEVLPSDYLLSSRAV